ncbi:hypothetical protein CALVIDRAFT_531763, partial [Calocera viscosa TUFC12733]
MAAMLADNLQTVRRGLQDGQEPAEKEWRVLVTPRNARERKMELFRVTPLEIAEEEGEDYDPDKKLLDLISDLDSIVVFFFSFCDVRSLAVVFDDLDFLLDFTIRRFSLVFIDWVSYREVRVFEVSKDGFDRTRKVFPSQVGDNSKLRD